MEPTSPAGDGLPGDAASEDVDDAATDDEAAADRPEPSRRRRILGAVAVGVAAAVAFGGLFALRRAGGPGYDEVVRENFIASCVRDGGEGVRPVCECVWERLRTEVPFDRFVEVDRQLADQVATVPEGTPLNVPDDVGVLVRACVEAS